MRGRRRRIQPKRFTQLDNGGVEVALESKNFGDNNFQIGGGLSFVDYRYGNLPGGGAARVGFWATL